MKISEALEELVIGAQSNIAETTDRDEDYLKILEHEKTLQELLEKETPKKVIEAAAYQYTRAAKCPVCNKRYSMSNSKKYIYCPHCGQKLDWSVKYGTKE